MILVILHACVIQNGFLIGLHSYSKLDFLDLDDIFLLATLASIAPTFFFPR